MRNFLSERTRIFWIVFGYLLIALIGSIDSQFRSEVNFLPLYLIPITILGWFVSRDHALAAAVIGTMMWSAADLYVQVSYSTPWIFYWNNLVVLFLFIFIALLISELRLRILNVSELYAIDTMTGALKSTPFLKIVSDEIERLKRTSNHFSLAYLDLDGLQEINTRSGFSAGDQILRGVVNTLRKHLRKTDLVARMGGDEFAIIFPETGQEAAREVISRLREHLADNLPTNQRKLTFSIGLLTCKGVPPTPDDLIKSALDAMQFVKKNGKDGVCFTSYPPT